MRHALGTDGTPVKVFGDTNTAVVEETAADLAMAGPTVAKQQSAISAAKTQDPARTPFNPGNFGGTAVMRTGYALTPCRAHHLGRFGGRYFASSSGRRRGLSDDHPPQRNLLVPGWASKGMELGSCWAVSTFRTLSLAALVAGGAGPLPRRSALRPIQQVVRRSSPRLGQQPSRGASRPSTPSALAPPGPSSCRRKALARLGQRNWR